MWQLIRGRSFTREPSPGDPLAGLLGNIRTMACESYALKPFPGGPPEVRNASPSFFITFLVGRSTIVFPMQVFWCVWGEADVVLVRTIIVQIVKGGMRMMCDCKIAHSYDVMVCGHT